MESSVFSRKFSCVSFYDGPLHASVYR